MKWYIKLILVYLVMGSLLLAIDSHIHPERHAMAVREEIIFWGEY